VRDVPIHMSTRADRALRPRELEVVRLLVEGLTSQEIADRLGVSRRTVHAHVANAMQRTGTRSRFELAMLALRTGLVQLTEPDDAGTSSAD
jgi:DNA-binding NarL/FixJ family response regulator